MKDLDRQMYKLADAGFNDILFNTNTANQALRYWGDVLDYMRGNIKVNKLPESLQSSSFAIRKLIDDYSAELSPILKGMNVKDDIIKNMGRYYIKVMKYLKTINIEHQKNYIIML